MIQILGTKRVLFLTLLLLLNVGLGLGLYVHLIPEQEKVTRNLRSTNQAIETKKQEIARIKEEIAMLRENLRQYKILQDSGFFGNQDRIVAKDAFQDIREESGILKAKYFIKAAKRIESEKAKAVDHVFLSSAINVDLESLDDIDIYHFIKLLQKRFPGNIELTSFELRKASNVNQAALRSIGGGQPVTMVKGTLLFNWRTMPSESKLGFDVFGE
jgi:hypothetical protein